MRNKPREVDRHQRHVYKPVSKLQLICKTYKPQFFVVIDETEDHWEVIVKLHGRAKRHWLITKLTGAITKL